MELEELKADWKTMNGRLDAMQATLSQTAGRRTSRGLMWEPLYELLLGFVTALCAGGFLWDNLAKIGQAPLGALPAVLLDACGIVTIGLSIWQLVTISEIDYANPIVESQRQLTSLRKLRVRATQWMLLLGIPLWIILPIFAGQALIGYDLWRSVSGPWILANLVFGAAFAGAVVFAARNYGDRWPVFGKIEASFAGTEIAKAEVFLDEIARFSAED